MNTCSICLNDTIDNENICKTNCGHMFCYECLHRWLEIKKDCPYCRKKVKEFHYKNEMNRIIYLNGDNIENINQNIDQNIENIDSLRNILSSAINRRETYKKLLLSLRVMGFISVLFMGSTIFLSINCNV